MSKKGLASEARLGGIVAKAGNWRGRRARREAPPLRARRPRPPHTETGDLMARLDRLEAVIRAIAAHLGIEAQSPRQVGTSRSEPLRGTARSDARESGSGAENAHAIVRTVARRLSGRVKLYHPERGYGFLVSPGQAGEVFFHRSDCRTDPATLAPSATVTFDLAEMANGHVKAVNLTGRT